jgi:hypothetical protein
MSQAMKACMTEWNLGGVYILVQWTSISMYVHMYVWMYIQRTSAKTIPNFDEDFFLWNVGT